MALEAWAGIREVTAFGAPCAQRHSGSAFQGNASQNGKEDCVSLNVWAPTWPVRRRLPVMVWIHGGGNFAGAAASDPYGDGSGNAYDGESLARRGVLVVTVNYRLGVLGFLAHPELSAESPRGVSGNYGLLDQIAALRWIRSNISRFGGDPDNVTVFGQSAGATDIGVLMTSPLAKGLFHRAIAQSGTVNSSPRTLNEAHADGLKFAAALGAPDRTSLGYLRGLSATELVNAPAPLFPAVGRGSIRHLVIDGHAVPRSPADVFADGRQHAVPLLIGSNSRERSPGLTALPTDLPAVIQRNYGPLAERAIALYGAASPDAGYGTPIEQWAGDSGFRCDSVHQALWHIQAGRAAYQYEFARSAPGRETVGAIHSAELWYVFGTLARGAAPEGPTPRYDDADRAISDAMQAYWTNFAKRGDPNDGRLSRWPRFNSSTRPYLQFRDRQAVAANGLRRPFCELYVENINRQMGR
jgi:para-nitrobenzyl esterase